MPRLPLRMAAAALAVLAAPAAHAQSSGDRASGWMEMDDHDSGRWGRGDDGGRDEQSWRDHHRRRAGGSGDDRDDDSDSSGDRSQSSGSRRMGDGAMGGGMAMHRFGGGARFMLRSGDVRLAVQCGSGETMKDCVEATIQLMDKARAQSRGSAAGSDTAPSSPNPPATSPQQ
ncbi:hypothetical protein WDZ92_39595 [Nostoc sp. NIES-2111]